MALIGVEPGQPGEPPVFKGAGYAAGAKDAILDRHTALRAGLKVGDTFTIKSIQDTKEEFYTLRVAGISDRRQFSLQPSVISRSHVG